MSYIKLINGFWVSHERNTFNCTEIALFFYLLKTCNLCHWPDSIKRNNTKIQADLCISYPTLSKARNKLKQAGIIDFKTTNGSSNVSYTFKKFLKVANEVANEVGDEVGDEVTNEVSDELNKIKDIDKDLNIIKEKNKKEKFSESISPTSPNNPPGGEEEKKSSGKRKEKGIIFMQKKLREIVVENDVAICHQQIVDFLTAHGFYCQKEYPVCDRGDGRKGRIDIYAIKDGVEYGIEIDFLSPRKKSVIKLNSLENDVVKIILLRGGKKQEIPGILVIPLNVKKENSEWDRKTRAFIDSIPDPEWRDLFTRWLKYKKDRGDSYKSEDSLKMALEKLNKMSGSDISVATEIVENSIANNWQGLFPLKNIYNNGINRNSEIYEVYAPVSDFSGTKSTL